MSSAFGKKLHEGVSFGWPRVLAACVGVWLIVSAFLWDHTHAQATNAVVCGVLAIAFAALASVEPRARYLNTILGAWILYSSVVIGGRPLTLWTEILTGPVLAALSLAPPKGVKHMRPPVRA